ncbi:immunity protein Imm2 [Xanthomonas campestris pv. cannae]|nr:immunity protein Imm2 [Xanthomonas campestris pv. cannae]
MKDDRAKYNEIRTWILDRCYEYCRLKAKGKSPWVEGESELGYAYDEFENSFETQVEKLMLEVIILILSAGRFSEKSNEYHMKRIYGILQNMDLSGVLKNLQFDEAEEFKADLRILGLLQ